jgi:hypothetical protein
LFKPANTGIKEVLSKNTSNIAGAFVYYPLKKIIYLFVNGIFEYSQ